jgi:hypothetical protein
MHQVQFGLFGPLLMGLIDFLKSHNEDQGINIQGVSGRKTRRSYFYHALPFGF